MPPSRRSVLAKIPNDMRIFERRYFNINRRFAILHGIWPYEVKTKKYVHRSVTIGLAVFFVIPQFISVVMHYKNIDRLMLSTLCLTVQLLQMLKLIGMFLAEEKMKELYRSIANNWERIEDYCERDVLHKYSERARTATIIYTAIIIAPCVIGSTFPLIPKFLDFIRPLENPRPNLYISEGEFLIDREMHFLPLFFVDQIGLLWIASVTVATDTTYYVSVEHCCALYAIIRSRLLKLRPIIQQSSSSDEDVDSYEWLRRTIQLHRSALACTSSVNDSYSLSFLSILVAALFVIPLNSCAIIANLDKPLHLIPYAACLVVIMILVFFLCYPGQRIIDHQLSLLDAVHCNEWHVLPLRTKKLLLTFMLRCSEPVMITAGGLLPMNFEVYFKIMKTAVSYITVASSFRER